MLWNLLNLLYEINPKAQKNDDFLLRIEPDFCLPFAEEINPIRSSHSSLDCSTKPNKFRI